MKILAEVGGSRRVLGMRYFLLVIAAVGFIGCSPTVEITEADLGRVTDLSLYYQDLTEIPSSLEKLTQLTELDLSRNLLIDLEGVEKLTQLTELDLGSSVFISDVQLHQLTKALPTCTIIHRKISR